MNTNKILRTTNPNEPATDAVTRTAQEILAALEARDAALTVFRRQADGSWRVVEDFEVRAG